MFEVSGTTFMSKDQRENLMDRNTTRCIGYYFEEKDILHRFRHVVAF
jgi:hypothetical protein